DPDTSAETGAGAPKGHCQEADTEKGRRAQTRETGTAGAESKKDRREKSGETTESQNQSKTINRRTELP
ncbi:MAG: hypothetical protein II265_03165, partial [Clostridia bacterium]|nr:hypothetical protein [Clostridia bacterium]